MVFVKIQDQRYEEVWALLSSNWACQLSISVWAKRILRAEGLNSWVHIKISPESFHRGLMILLRQTKVGELGICILKNSRCP